ncbi:glycosyltransferase family 2 protein [Patescibacteria group bacterium]|nr:glycosyltransferase family 2 protein [Patescibacteria group bacterium]
MENKVYLSVIIPAYNEESRLNNTLKEIDAYLKTQSYLYEIVVVNDGSKDRTAEVVNELSLSIKDLRLINNKENRGKGFIVKQGMTEALGQYRLFSDADNSVSIDQIEKIWPVLKQGYEVVIGSRSMKESIIDPCQAWPRRLIGKAGNLVIQTIGGLSGIWDSQCGFKCFTGDSAQNIFSKTMINRWGFDVESLVLAKKLGYQIKEIPVIWKNDFRSTVRLFGIIKTFFEVLQIRWNLITNKYNL